MKFHWPVFCSLSTENVQDSLYVFQISILGGGFGGALRGLMMLITETGGPIKGTPVSENPDWYLSRWTHYGVKPFIGAGVGLLFFCAVNFGAVRVLTGSSDLKHLKPLPIFFVSAIGGLFFEEVKEILWNLLGTFSARKDTAQKKSGQNDGK